MLWGSRCSCGWSCKLPGMFNSEASRNVEQTLPQCSLCPVRRSASDGFTRVRGCRFSHGASSTTNHAQNTCNLQRFLASLCSMMHKDVWQFWNCHKPFVKRAQNSGQFLVFDVYKESLMFLQPDAPSQVFMPFAIMSELTAICFFLLLSAT